jgi:hypothetical protein
MSRFRRLSPGRTAALGLLSMMVFAGFTILPARTRADGPASVPSAELSRLQQQRIDTLRQAANAARQMYSQGSIAFEEVCRFDRLLIDAQLESAVSADERIKLLQSARDVARKQEDLASRHHEAGMGTALAALEARADRLHIEIRLAEMGAK